MDRKEESISLNSNVDFVNSPDKNQKNRSLCNHEWKKLKFLYDYWDYSGWHVGVFEVECQKCGLRTRRKYY